MKTLFVLIAALTGLILPYSAMAADDEVTCEANALTDYARAYVEAARPPASMPVVTVAQAIALRRLEEDLCLKIAHCRAKEETAQTMKEKTAQTIVDVEFSKCLDDEDFQRAKENDAINRR